MENCLRNSLPTTSIELEEQMQLLDEAQALCRARVRELMAAEDLAAGICHAAAIHEYTQCRNMLETHKEYRRVRINRLSRQ